MRNLSLNFREAINAQESGEIAIFLLTVDHDDFSDQIHLSSDPTERLTDVPLLYATVSRGITHYFLPMTIALPEEREGSPPRTQVRISFSNLEVLTLIRSTTTPARVKIELVLASDPDTVEVESPWLDLIGATNNAGEITLELSLNSMTQENYPVDSFDPAAFPGLHSRGF
jgi:hypothetical protein